MGMAGKHMLPCFIRSRLRPLFGPIKPISGLNWAVPGLIRPVPGRNRPVPGLSRPASGTNRSESFLNLSVSFRSLARYGIFSGGVSTVFLLFLAGACSVPLIGGKGAQVV